MIQITRYSSFCTWLVSHKTIIFLHLYKCYHKPQTFLWLNPMQLHEVSIFSLSTYHLMKTWFSDPCVNASSLSSPFNKAPEKKKKIKKKEKNYKRLSHQVRVLFTVLKFSNTSQDRAVSYTPRGRGYCFIHISTIAFSF